MAGVLKGLLALALCCAAAVAQAQPGHYIVVSVDAQGQLSPVHYRAIELDAAHGHAARAPETARKRATRDASQLLATGAGWTQVVQAPERIRGEFAANGVRGRIQSYAVRPQRRSFVLRVPASAGDTITLDHQGRRSVLDLRQIARQPSLVAAPPARVLKSAAATANRLDIVVIGDGYTASEQTKFQTDVAAFRSQMFATTPYKEYANYVNFVPLFVASSQSGADHPPYQAGCTSSSCCAETAAQTDPRAGTFVNTALDGKFCAYQIHRLLVVDDNKAYAAANAYPNWDMLIVIVNDPVYGGSGGAVSTFSAHSSAGLIAIHEFGHSFTNLADEYDTPYPDFPACDDTAGSPTPDCERNVTNLAQAAQVKWRAWFTPGIAIPTPAGTAGVGLFAGARYHSTGMYRPKHACAMRSLGDAFCPVCAESYLLRLYTPNAGNNFSPIDLIEPGSEVPSTSSMVTLVAGTSRAFSTTVLRPSPDTVRMQWYLDNQPISGATGPSYAYLPATARPSRRVLRLDAWDSSALVSAGETAPLKRSRVWNLQVRAKAHADFNGDGRSDVLWRNAGTGGNDLWRSASAAQRQVTATVSNLQWKVAGLGDFNGDGRADVLWRNASTGANDLWLSANAATRQPIAAEANTAWTVSGVGDFNGDGRADIFWRNTATGANAMWPSADRSRAQAATGVADLNWRVAGVADFDADGRDDIVWRHAVSGASELWRSGTSAMRKVLGVQAQAWKLGGLGDFNQDGQADIFWRNGSTGANMIWLSGNPLNGQLVTAIADQNWKVAMVGDFDGDATADVLWRNAVTGSNELWRSGLSSQRTALARVSDVRWAVSP